MGIEIPPPKGGPATFPKVTSAEPLSPLTPEEDEPSILKPVEDSEQNDDMSLCLSEGILNPAFKFLHLLLCDHDHSFVLFL